MADSSWWWVATGTAIGLELISGTFYLLMIAIGLAAGAVAALLGLPLPLQLSSAALVGGGSVLACYFIRRRGNPGIPPSADRSMELDVGENVQVDGWNPDGTSLVRYRGAHWTAVLRPGNAATPGTYRIAEVVGNRLLVDRA